MWNVVFVPFKYTKGGFQWFTSLQSVFIIHLHTIATLYVKFYIATHNKIVWSDKKKNPGLDNVVCCIIM